MRALYLLALIYIGFTLSSCSTVETPSSKSTFAQETNYKKKNPFSVSFYSHTKPKKPYMIIGEEHFSKFNSGGNKRQEAIIRDGMRELAAAMGGDAVIDLKHDNKSISGTVIAFQETPVTPTSIKHS